MSDNRLHLDIIDQEKQLLSQDVEMILAPTQMGQIGLLPGHISLFASLEAGELIITRNGKEDIFAVSGGFLDVNQDKVTVLANSAIHSQDIDVKKVEAAKKKAQETMNKQQLSQREYKLAEADLRRAILELKVAKKRHYKANQAF